jgi:hypothetical protein
MTERHPLHSALLSTILSLFDGVPYNDLRSKIKIIRAGRQESAG